MNETLQLFIGFFAGIAVILAILAFIIWMVIGLANKAIDARSNNPPPEPPKKSFGWMVTVLRVIQKGLEQEQAKEAKQLEAKKD